MRAVSPPERARLLCHIVTAEKHLSSRPAQFLRPAIGSHCASHSDHRHVIFFFERVFLAKISDGDFVPPAHRSAVNAKMTVRFIDKSRRISNQRSNQRSLPRTVSPPSSAIFSPRSGSPKILDHFQVAVGIFRSVLNSSGFRPDGFFIDKINVGRACLIAPTPWFAGAQSPFFLEVACADRVPASKPRNEVLQLRNFLLALRILDSSETH